jgi:SsrA-binding protein
MATLIVNKKARFDYSIIKTFSAGMSLSGGLVKIIRGNLANLQGVYIVYQNKSLQIIGFGSEKVIENITLLLRKNELHEIVKALDTKGITCIPLKIYTSKRWLKVEIALVKGKKNWDKRQTIKDRDLDREERKGVL